MGQQKATLSMDNLSVTLSIYTESDEEIDYEQTIAQVELETPTGKTYKERKEVKDTGSSGVLNAISTFFSEADNSHDILRDALENAISKAEQDLEMRMLLDTQEMIYEFEQNTQNLN